MGRHHRRGRRRRVRVLSDRGLLGLHRAVLIQAVGRIISVVAGKRGCVLLDDVAGIPLTWCQVSGVAASGFAATFELALLLLPGILGHRGLGRGREERNGEDAGAEASLTRRVARVVIR